jgi:hypothetical protein
MKLTLIKLYIDSYVVLRVETSKGFFEKQLAIRSRHCVSGTLREHYTISGGDRTCVVLVDGQSETSDIKDAGVPWEQR